MAVQALYLHIPFCHARCAYCDFETCALGAASFEHASDRYLARLYARVDALGAAGALQAVRTVYVGGGTPSVLGLRLAELVRRVLHWCQPSEITCEANPESFTDELAEALAAAGVTRISLGVQSLCDAELASIGRIHTAQMALEAIVRARRAEFSVSCDLMCGLPGQTLKSWLESVEAALAAGPHHVSVYPLTLEEGTPLAARAEQDPSLVPDEDLQAAAMEMARSACMRSGRAPYEVASYALPGHACAHNVAYWTGVSYLGVGRSAAGMLAREEWSSMAPFFPGVQPTAEAARIRLVQRDDAARRFDAEFLTERGSVAEDLMLGMRMTAGVGPRLMSRAQRVFGHAFSNACATAQAEGLARLDDATGALVPTERGWLMGNELYGLMWDLADAPNE